LLLGGGGGRRRGEVGGVSHLGGSPSRRSKKWEEMDEAVPL